MGAVEGSLGGRGSATNRPSGAATEHWTRLEDLGAAAPPSEMRKLVRHALEAGETGRDAARRGR